MPDYTTYDLATGKLKQNFSMPDDMMAANYDPLTEGLLEGHLDPGSGYVVGQELLPYPEKPGPWAVFDFSTGEWIDPRTSEDLAAEFEQTKDNARRSLLAACTDFETPFITPLPAQPMKYAKKEAEARSYLTSEDPILDQYPWIASEVGPDLTGDTPYQVAQVYLNMADQWTAIATRYEPIRIACINRIDAATTPAELQDALTTFSTQMQTLIDWMSNP